MHADPLTTSEVLTWLDAQQVDSWGFRSDMIDRVRAHVHRHAALIRGYEQDRLYLLRELRKVLDTLSVSADSNGPPRDYASVDGNRDLTC